MDPARLADLRRQHIQFLRVERKARHNDKPRGAADATDLRRRARWREAKRKFKRLAEEWQSINRAKRAQRGRR